MDQKFRIRAIAMCIAREVYSNVDSNLSIDNLDLSFAYHPTTPNITISERDVVIALKYLDTKGIIKNNLISSKVFSGKLTAFGIDWIEDSYNVDYKIF